MGKLFSELKMIAVLLLVLSIVMGCGTGGLDTSQPSATTTTTIPTTPPTPTTATITGRVVDGFIAGATVRAYQINANGTRGDAIGASTTTDANGSYSLSLNYTGPVLVESAGGAYTDWATGKTVTLTPADKLSAVMSDAKDAVTINITPLTHMAALRAQQDMAVNKTAVAAAIDTANSKIGEYFGGINIIKDTPIDPAVGNSSSGVSQTKIDYAMVLAGISQNALTNNLNPFSLAMAMAKDASDGVFDGKQGATQLTVENAAGGGATNLPATAAKGDLSTNINAFQNSATNKSGGTITTSILTNLSSPTNIGVIRAKPDPPPGITTAVLSPAQIKLSWSISPEAAGYRIYRDSKRISDVTVTTFTDMGLTASTLYCYSLSAYDLNGNESVQSSQVCATTLAPPPPVPPPVPTGLTAASVSQSQINLSWTATTGAAGYNIYRAGTYWTSVTTTVISDTGLAASTEYCYTISSMDAAGNSSAQSSAVCVTTPATPPPTPSGLAVTALSTSEITLSWTAAAGAAGYKIYKNSVLLKSVTTNAATDTGLSAGTSYCYMISAYGATGSESAPGGQKCATTSSIPVPTNITVTALSENQINVSWSASAGATGYQIYRNSVLLKAVTTTSLSDTGLTENTQYCYGVSALDGTGNESVKSSQACATTQSPPVPASIDLLVSNTQLNSDGATTVTLTALVKDSANRAMKDQDVNFSSSTGLLTVTSGKTDALGTATATLGTGGNPANRSITVTAATGSINSTNTVNVSGTTIDISGLNSLSLDDSTPLTIFLKNSAGVGIGGKTITVTSEKGNTLSAASYVTNANGQITVNVKATTGGIDNITASAIGAIKVFSLTVDPNLFKIRTPTAGKEVNIGTNEAITVEYTTSGAPVVGAAVNFATTRGTLSSSTAMTGADGKATVTTSSTNSGPGLISAFVTGGPSAQVAVEFVAPTASKMSLQANPAVIGTNGAGLTAEKSLITAIVRDANDNLVKNKTIKFTIVNDASAGSLSPGSATTDSSGTANTYFIAGATPGGVDSVMIQASIVDTPAVTASAKLTVARKALFITMSTGPSIGVLEPVKYKKDYVALVSDAAGNPVEGAAVTATVTPMYFRKGYYVWRSPLWIPVPTLVASSTTLPAIPGCANEDGLVHNPLYDYNGVLDPGEDANINNRLDPGNVASVTATPTDSNGFSTVSIVYAKDYTYWVNVKLEVKASTTGDTSSALVNFDLPGLTADFTVETQIPPGYISPFGTSTTCFDTRPDAPAGLTATAASTTQVNLSWQAAARATGYKIYRGGVFLKSATTVSGADTGLSSGTQYCYTVSAYDATGSDSAPSAQVCVTTASLAAPTNFAATAASSSQTNLSWTASAGAASYKIYKGGTYLKSVAATNTTDTGLNSSTQYCYAVSAVDATNIESAQSSQLCATTPALAAPTNLTVTAATSSQINLTWTASSGASGYRIYRGGMTLKSVTATSASDTGLAADAQYCYALSAYDSANNESPQTGQLCATTYGPPPPDPAGLTVSAVSPTQVNLAWSASIGAAQYIIYRNGTLLSSTSSATYTDNTVVANTQYAYRVTAIDQTGSESSGQASQGTAHTGLTVPATVTATVNSSTQITISWVNSGGALVTGYKVYKKGNLLGAVSATSVVDGGLTPSTQYCYNVTATDASGIESSRSSTVCATTQAPPVPTSIDLLFSNPQLNSDGSSPITITVLVKDNGNRAMAGQKVTFTADSGILTIIDDLTNPSGQATATLGTGGDPKNRTITVTASVGSVAPVTKTVEVAGTAVTISGQSSTVLVGSTTTLTVYLKDSGGKGIPSQSLTLTSAKGNTLTPATVTTNASGQATTVFTAAQGGADTVTATSTSMTATGSFTITVQTDPNTQTLTFTAPTSDKEIAIKTNETVTVHYADKNGPLAAKTVNFSSTRGTIAATAVTDGNGDATLTISSTTPGPAVLTASVTGGPTATVPVEFVATTAANINLQADPATIGINLSGSTTQRSNIVTVVRDADNNLIKNKTVNFNIVDPSGGSLSSGTAVTDSFGSASVQFIAGATASAKDGVTVSATVAGTAITSSTTLTVAQKSLFITVGTGNQVVSVAPNNYQLDFGVLVTDAAGNAIKDATVVASLLPVVYMKGYYLWVWDDPPTNSKGHWQQTPTLTSSNHPVPPAPNTPYPWPAGSSCANEDLTYYNDPNNKAYLLNGILDPGENFNGNGNLDPGGIASVTATAKTDANGVGTLTVTYAKQFATWVNIRLDVHVPVSGTEGAASTTLFLPGARSDYSSFDISPPGAVSPFGQSATCANSI